MKVAKSWDFAGVALSSICIVHCIAIPVILLLFPAVGSALVPYEEQTHLFILAFILGVAVFAFLNGYKVHGQKKPVIWLAVGVIIATYASLFAHDHLGHHWEPVIAIAGSIALIRAHILNHKCKKCNRHDCSHQS